MNHVGRYATIFFVTLGLLPPTAQAQIEPEAGTWKTWVLTSGAEFRLPPSPNQAATQQELRQLQTLQTQRDAEAIRQIEYWNAGAPGYRWRQLLRVQEIPPPLLIRMAALLHVGIYDATVAAWDSKYAHRRPRPALESAHLLPPDNPAYPCEHAVTAGAASEILAYLFPSKADSVRQLAQQAGRSRLLAGVSYPSDVEAGLALGRAVAAKVIAWAQADGSAASWTGTVPTQAGLWRGARPLNPTRGSWKTWVLTSGDQFRPPAPPDFTSEMAELKAAKHTFQSDSRAFYWANRFLSDEISTLLFENHLATNPPLAARVYALTSVAEYDASVACFNAKYAYWGIRPDQFDSTYHPLLVNPPFPGYPSGHATVSSAAATVLGYLFPNDGLRLQQMAKECAQSRFDGGIHFRIDNEVGLDMGRKVGSEVIKWAERDGSNVGRQVVKK